MRVATCIRAGPTNTLECKPDEPTYYPAGSTIESVTPDGKEGLAFNTRHAILGVTLKGMVPNARQDALHEGVNDQCMTFTVNAFLCPLRQIRRRHRH